MQKVANILAKELISNDFISEDKKNNYTYGIEFVIMKIIGIAIIFITAGITGKYIETIVFYIVFNSLRKYTNGYHAKNPITCIIASFITLCFIFVVLSSFLISYIYYLHFTTFIAIFMIYSLSPVNSDMIMLSKKEIEEHKQKIKYILIVYLIALSVFVNFEIENATVVFFDLAIVLDLLLVVIGRIIYKGEKHEKC